MVFLTLEELKQALEIYNSDLSKDTILQIYIDGISAFIISMIGRNMLKEDYVERYEGTNSTELILKHYPVNTIKSIQFVVDNKVQEVLSDYSYILNKKSGILYRDRGWWLQGDSTLMSRRIDFPRKHIKVEYNAGYDPIPGDLKLLALQLVKEQYNIDSSDGNKQGLKSYSIDDVRMEWKQGQDIRLNDKQIATINKYKGVKF